MNKSIRNLLSKEYFPFGSQYYRAPSPHRKDWEKDIKHMSELGFNTIKFWIQWRWNNPAEGEFYYDDIDELMDLAYKYELRVMLNTIFDVAPAWIYRKFPDASMVSLSGQWIGPQTQPHRQIGGLGYCFNHDRVSEYLFKFLSETIKKYKNHPALEIWNVGSEPELTSSMSELRSYAYDANKMGDMLCYCKNCEVKFKFWLKKKYRTLKKLNASWNRNYQSFDEIELPRTRNTFNDLIDWRMFFVFTLGENIKQRFKVARKIDKGKHPLMCHHVFVQGFPITSTANDPWNVGKYGELHGFTQMDDIAMIDILRSCAKDKPVISAEMLMLPGYTLELPKLIDTNDIKRLIFGGIAGNLKGFIYWQYRPEILGRETPTWGLTSLDGNDTPWLKAFADVGKVLQQNASFLLEARTKKADVAILYNPENQIFAWAATGNEKNATDSLLGYHKALYENNFRIDFIHPNEFPEILNNYKVLIIPFPYVLNKEIVRKIEKWIYKGGILISECFTAGWNREGGHHETMIPGYNLYNVFKVKQNTSEPADVNGIVEIKTTKALPYLEKGSILYGSIVKESYSLEGAKVLATFNSGEPAITYAAHGKGSAIQIGSYIGLHFYKYQNESNANLITSIVQQFSKIRKPACNKKVRVDLVERKSKSMIIIKNLEKKRCATTIKLELKSENELEEQFTGEKIKPRKSRGAKTLTLNLKADEVKVYYG